MAVDLLRWTFFGLSLLFVQVGMGSLLHVFGARPDLLIIYSLMLGLSRGANVGLIAGALTGLVQDAVTTHYWGVYALARSTVVFWMVRLISDREGWLKGAGWGAFLLIASLLQESISGCFLLMDTGLSFWRYALQSILPSAIYTALVGWLWSQLPWGEVAVGAALQNRVSSGRRVRMHD